ncbi:MAG TPA: hypothetical protein VGC54_01820 [Planctomycetota bacterium]
MRHQLPAWLLLAALLAGAGCLQSLHPLYSEKGKDTVYLPELAGNWLTLANEDGEIEPQSRWQLRPAGGGYSITITEKGQAAEFEGWVVEIGAAHYLDTWPRDAGFLANQVLKLHLLPAHLFWRAEARPYGWLLELVFSNELYDDLKSAEPPLSRQRLDRDYVVLDASPAQLREFLRAGQARPAYLHGTVRLALVSGEEAARTYQAQLGADLGD